MHIATLKKAISTAQSTLANAQRQSANAKMNITSEIQQWEQTVFYWKLEIERLTNLVQQS